MKKFLLAVLLLVGIALVPITITHAQLGNALENLNNAVGPGSNTGLQGDIAVSIGGVIKGLLSLVGTIFLLLTVYAGILWMTAQGDESKVEKSKSIIRASVIGLVITLSAYAITFFVTTKLTGVGGSGAAGAGGTGRGNAKPCSQAPAPGGECIVDDGKNNQGREFFGIDEYYCEGKNWFCAKKK